MTLYVGPTITIANPPDIMGPGMNGGGYGGSMSDWVGITQSDLKQMMRDLNFHYTRGKVIQALNLLQKKIDAVYESSALAAEEIVEKDLETVGFASGNRATDFAVNLRLIDDLIETRKIELESTLKISFSYSGSDPLTLTNSQRTNIGITAMGNDRTKFPDRLTEQLDSYGSSYKAAKDAVIMSNALKLLVIRATSLADKFLAAGTGFLISSSKSAQLSVAGGSIALTSGVALTLDNAIKSAVAFFETLRSAASLETAAGVASRWIPIAALVWPSSLGNSDLDFSKRPQTILTTPINNLAIDNPHYSNSEWMEIATGKGVVNIPYRIHGEYSKYSVVATQSNTGIPSQVKVRALTLNRTLNAYTFITTEALPRTLVFPISQPGNSSTATPAYNIEVPVYTGVTITPIKPETETLPAFENSHILDGIYVFPIESGLPPIYAVFSSPYEDATTRGKYSGRMYNPEKSGGPILDLDWKSTSITQEGLALVKLHTSRFYPSDANMVMIDRLEKILYGDISVTDIDKRFYTHEIRELARYRALGVPDGEEGKVWNNAHTATLEDYKLNERLDPMYTESAIIAGQQQEYTDAMKGV